MLVLVAATATSQSTTSPQKPSQARSNPRISVEFSKAAVRALVTIGTTRQQALVDAAMIDLSAAQSTRAESVVMWHIQLFKDTYGVNEFIGDHSGDQRCITAWLPKLRGLIPEIPNECPRLIQK
jgi:hypothetical protein